MASGNDFRIGLSKETTFGTRVTPARFIPLTGESLAFQRNRAFSAALGMGRWQRPSVLTTRAGEGSIEGEVPTTGFGYLLAALHGNTVTPVQQAATIAYLQTHTLDTPPSKSYSIQKQIPPVNSNTLVPVDYVGAVASGITLSWDPGGLLKYEIPMSLQDEQTGNAAATYVAPTAWLPFSFQGGTVKIATVAEANVIGSGSLQLGANLRTDAFALGTGGIMAQPVETDKPEATMTFTADFNDLVNINRVVNNTIADVELMFVGATIASTYKYYIKVTLADCVFTSPSPTVDDPGPVQQAVTLTAASTTGDPPVIEYMSIDTTI